MAQRSRGWIFTWNNYPPTHDAILGAIVCSYLVYGREVAPATGTPHLQGYVYFENPVRFAFVRQALGGHVHIACVRGSPADNRRYCIKDGDFVERGDLPVQGRRTDFLRIREAVNAGMSFRRIAADVATSYQSLRSAELLVKYRIVDEDMPYVKCVTWIWGPAGTGKTRCVFDWCRRHGYNNDMWVAADSLKWFDTYDGHQVAVFDDLRHDDVTYR